MCVFLLKMLIEVFGEKTGADTKKKTGADTKGNGRTYRQSGGGFETEKVHGFLQARARSTNSNIYLSIYLSIYIYII